MPRPAPHRSRPLGSSEPLHASGTGRDGGRVPSTPVVAAGAAASVRHVTTRGEAGRTSPVVDRVHPLDRAAEALADQGAGHRRGKTVLAVTPASHPSWSRRPSPSHHRKEPLMAPPHGTRPGRTRPPTTGASRAGAAVPWRTDPTSPSRWRGCS
nr:zinc-binding dehydrogenase [Nocardiopsis sp. FIRDI 009]